MSWSAVRSLVWKDYRQLRGLWCAIAVGTFALQGLVLGWHWGSTLLPDTAYRILSTGMLMTAIYGIATAGILFAGEQEEGTADFLARLPMAGIRIAGVKIALALLTMVMMLGVVLLTGGVWIWASRILEGMSAYNDPTLWILVLFVLIFFIWGVGTSLVLRHVLWSVLLAALGGLLTIFSPSYFQVTLVEFGFLLVLLAVVDVVLAWRWNKEGVQWGALWERMTRGKGWMNLVVIPAAGGRPAVERVPEEKRAWERLVWMERRNARWFVILTFPILIGIGVVGFSTEMPIRFARVFLANDAATERRGLNLDEMAQGMGVLLPFVLACFAGVLSWGGETRRRQYVFQAERGFSPAQLLWSKNRVWLVVAGLIAAGLFVFCYLLLSRLENSIPLENRETATLSLLLASWVVVLFLWSELVSLMIPSGVLATFGALAGGGCLMAGAYRMWSLSLPIWVSVLPCIALLGIALRMRVRDWMLSRPGWWPYLKIVGVLGLGWVGITTMGGCYRAWEMPKVEFPLRYAFEAVSFEKLERGSDEDRLLAQRFVVEMARMFWPDLGKPQVRGLAAGPVPGIVEENERLLFSPAARKEIQLQVGMKPRNEPLGEMLSNQKGIVLLANIHLSAAERGMKEGKLEEAFEHLCDGVRIVRLLYRGKMLSPEEDQMLTQNLEHFRTWSAAAGQSAERVKAGIRRLEEEFRKFPPLHERVLLEEGWSERQLAWIFRRRGWMDLLTGAWPWELERGRRMLRMSYAADYVRACHWETSGKHQPPIGMWMTQSENLYWRDIQQQVDAMRRWRWNLHDPYLLELNQSMSRGGVRGYASMLTWMRGTLLVMGVCAYRLEEGKLPERLDDLIGRSFGELPRDPQTLEEFRYEPRGLPSGVTLSGLRGMPAGTAFVYRGEGFYATTIGAMHKDMVKSYKFVQSREGRRTDSDEVFEIPPMAGVKQ